MYACRYVRTYVCMCVCVYACMYVCTYACMHLCMYVTVCMYVCMHVYAYTYTYTYIYTHFYCAFVFANALPADPRVMLVSVCLCLLLVCWGRGGWGGSSFLLSDDVHSTSRTIRSAALTTLAMRCCCCSCHCCCTCTAWSCCTCTAWSYNHKLLQLPPLLLLQPVLHGLTTIYSLVSLRLQTKMPTLCQSFCSM